MRISTRLFVAAAAIAALVLAVVGAPTWAGVGVLRTVEGAAQYVPTWSWYAAQTGALPPGSTFTRASSARCTNSSGVQVAVAANTACLDTDPSTLTALGYRSEIQSTNLVTQSQDLSNAYWTGTGVTIAGNSIVSPDGGTNAASLTEDTSTGQHQLASAGTLMPPSVRENNHTSRQNRTASVRPHDVSPDATCPPEKSYNLGT